MIPRSIIATPIAVAFLALSVTALATASLAADGERRTTERDRADLSAFDSDEIATYIVRLEEPPAARYRGGIEGLPATSAAATESGRFDADHPAVRQYRSHLRERQEDVLQRIERATGQRLDAERRWQLALNGFAVEVDGDTAQRLADTPGVAHVKREIQREPLTFEGPEFIGSEAVWDGTTAPGVASKGEGMVIAVVDTGINPDHASFAEVAPGDGYVHDNPLGDNEFIGVCDPDDSDYDPDYDCNNKLIGAFDFTGGGGGGPPFSADDDNGHGTHVAGTAAGNPMTTDGIEVSGVAPRANLINYRICDDNGCAGMPDVAEDILDRGIVDVVNYSIGPVDGGGDPYNEASAQSFLSLNEAGVIVAAAGGNSGPDAETISNFAPWNLTVASNAHGGYAGHPVSVTAPDPVPDSLQELVGVPAAEDGTPEDDIGPRPLAYAGDAGDELACDSLPAGSMDNAIGVAWRGECPFEEKAENLADAGAEAMIVVNNEPGVMTMGGVESLPAVLLPPDDGQALIDWIQNEDGPEGEILDETVLGATDGGLLSDFSSRGPGEDAYTEIPGPDVAAPGDQVLAAWIGNDDPFETIGGTSMASPHVAGAAALMRAVYPDLSPTQIQSALMLHADPEGVFDGEGDPVTPHGGGSGLVALGDAARAGLVLDETKQNFEDADPDGGSLELHELNIPYLSQRSCGIACTWTRSFEAVRDGSWTVTSDSDFDLTAEPESFSLEAGETQEVTFTVSQEDDSAEWIFGHATLESPDSDIPDARLPVIFEPTLPPPDSGDDFDLDGVEVPAPRDNLLEIAVDAPDGTVSGLSWDLTYETIGEAWLEEFRIEIEAPDGTTILAGGDEAQSSEPGDNDLDYLFGWPGESGTDSDARSIDDFDGSESGGVWIIRLWGTWEEEDPAGTLLEDSEVVIDIEDDEDFDADISYDPQGGSYFVEDAPVSVTLTEQETGADIHYTLDGSDPDGDSPSVASGESVDVSGDDGETVELRTMASGDDEIFSESYEFHAESGLRPSFSPDGGDFVETDAASVTLSSEDDEAEIFYTLDGSKPDGDSDSVDSGESVGFSRDAGESVTIRAFAETEAGTTEEADSDSYDFHPEVDVVDSDGTSLDVVDAGPGDSVDFEPTGGAGSFEVEASANSVSGEEGSLVQDGDDWTFTPPEEGAFAGRYDITVTDPDTGDSKTVEVVVDLVVAVEEEVLILGDEPREIEVTGATPGYSLDLEVQDPAGQSSDVAVAEPATAEAEDDHGSGNPAVATLVSDDVEGNDFRVEVVPETSAYDPVVREGLETHPMRAYSGWVQDSVGDPIAEAEVRTAEEVGPDEREQRYATESESDGVFSLLAPEPEGDDYELTADRSGYVMESFDGADCVGDQPHCTVTLEAGAEIRGELHGLLESEEAELTVVDESDDTRIGPHVVTAGGSGEDAWTIEVDAARDWDVLEIEAFGYEFLEEDNDGDGFSFSGDGDVIEGIELEPVPTTPQVLDGAGSVTDTGTDGAELTITISPNERATEVFVDYGPEDGDLDETTEAEMVAADAGESELTMALDDLDCDSSYAFQVRAVNDVGNEHSGDTGTFETDACEADEVDEGDEEGVGDEDGAVDEDEPFIPSGGFCSMQVEVNRIDPLLPALWLVALIGLAVRNRRSGSPL